VELVVDPANVKGFLAPEEGEALYRSALAVCERAPCLEIGSYCGKSTLYLGAACKERGGILFAVDHHRGSEEHQPGEEYHDPALYDAEEQRVDSFRVFRRTLRDAGLEDTVAPIVAPSAVAARRWATPLSLVFIDGGHSLEAAFSDYRNWSPHLLADGILAVHDLFPDPAQGGQAPWEMYQEALASGLFSEQQRVMSLGLLRRLG